MYDRSLSVRSLGISSVKATSNYNVFNDTYTYRAFTAFSISFKTLLSAITNFECTVDLALNALTIRQPHVVSCNMIYYPWQGLSDQHYMLPSTKITIGNERERSLLIRIFFLARIFP